MLQTLDKQFLLSNKQLKKEKTERFLETLGRPKRWRNMKGTRCNLVTTVFTERASELFDVYRQLQDFGLPLVSSTGSETRSFDPRQDYCQ